MLNTPLAVNVLGCQEPSELSIMTYVDSLAPFAPHSWGLLFPPTVSALSDTHTHSDTEVNSLLAQF